MTQEKQFSDVLVLVMSNTYFLRKYGVDNVVYLNPWNVVF